MENAYPGSNILVVTLTNGESKRVEAQSDKETLEEAMGVLRDMFGPHIPNATDILVPRWWNNRFQRGSYSNYPIISDNQDVHDIKVFPSYFCCMCLSVFTLAVHGNSKLQFFHRKGGKKINKECALKCISKSCLFLSGPSRTHLLHW